jgi:hypothetical protein
MACVEVASETPMAMIARDASPSMAPMAAIRLIT